MSEPPEELQEVRKQLERGQVPPEVTARTFLAWFGAQRRGVGVVRGIRGALEELELETDPDFESAYIDSEIGFRRTDAGDGTTGATQASDAETDGEEATPEVRMIGGTVSDPTYRMGRLASANQALFTVKPDATLREATTLMLVHDVSQLPVMQSEFTVKGMVSWSSIGAKLALGLECKTVSDCMEDARVVSSEASLFDVIDTIVRYQYVLIRNTQNRITGIVTTSDLSLQFRQLGEPFLLLGEIENHVRSLLMDKFTEEQVAEVRDPTDQRQISSVADMTFGQYIRLVGKPEHWDLLRLNLDRSVLIKDLDRIRLIRNDVMHFDPDGLSEDDLSFLRDFARFMQRLRRMGALGQTSE